MSSGLEGLLVSGQELDKKLVADVLNPFLRIDRETCTIRPLPEWEKLKTNSRILLYLLARKAMVALALPLKEEGATATEVSVGTGLKQGTVNPALRALLDMQLVRQTKERKYFVPNQVIERVKSVTSPVHKTIEGNSHEQ